MSMRIIRPEYTDPVSAAAVLVGSNVPEADYAVWAAGTTYAAGARVIVAATHMIYESVVAGNLGNSPPANLAGVTPKWLEVSPTNRYKMFDASASTVTENAGTIDVTLTSARGDSIYLGGLEAQSIEIHQTDETGTIYYHAEDLTLQNVFDWYGYFYEPIIRKTDLVLTDLPSAGGSSIRVVLHAEGSVAKCGTLIIGKVRDLGELQWKPRFRLIDYSRKVKDEFGNFKLVPRANARLISCELFVAAGQFDEVNRLISEYTSQVLLWSGASEAGDYATLNVLGFLRDFDHVLDSPAGSLCNLEIEGLI